MFTTRHFLLIVHVAGAVLFVGPVTVAASLFPNRAKAALDGHDADEPVARLLNRITRSYGWSALVVPAVGLALAAESNYFQSRWLQAALVLHIIATALLLGRIIPAQERIVASFSNPATTSSARAQAQRLHGDVGLFSVLWVVVLGLMVVKPW